MEYHVIIVPLFQWETLAPKSFDDLTALMKIAGGLFGFELPNIEEEEKSRSTSTGRTTVSPDQSRALLSRRLHHTRHEVGSIHSITNVVREKCQEQVEILKIEEAYASDFSFEIVSSSDHVFGQWQEDFHYDELAGNLSDILYDKVKSFPGAVSIAVCKIILCDEVAQLKAIAKELDLRRKRDYLLYLGSKDPGIAYNIFNFVSGPWRKIFISNPIATLKPEQLQAQGYHTTNDELNFLVSLIHSIGKFYAIMESSRGFRASLEWSSWYMDDLFERFESKYCWAQRNFSNISRDLRRIEKAIKSDIIPLGRISASPESVTLIQQVYGVEYLPYVSSFLEVLSRFNVKKYKIPVDEIRRSTFEDLKSLSQSITDFWKELSTCGESWKEIRRSTVTHNQLLLTLIGLGMTIIVNIALRIFG